MSHFEVNVPLRKQMGGGGFTLKEEESAFKDLIGATVVDIGVFPDTSEGGLSVDYLKPGESKVRRIVFGYNDLGEWLEWRGIVKGKVITSPVQSVLNDPPEPKTQIYKNCVDLVEDIRQALRGHPTISATSHDNPSEKQIGFQVDDVVYAISLVDLRNTNKELQDPTLGVEPIPYSFDDRKTWIELRRLEMNP